MPDTTVDTAAISEIDPGLVTVGSPVEGGCVFTDLAGKAAAPTGAAQPLEGFVSLGELSTNGFTQSTEVNTTEHQGWHGTTLLTEITDQKEKVKLEFVEVDRLAVAQLRYGVGNVKPSADDPSTFEAIDVKGVPSHTVPLVIDELESNGWLRRTVYPKVKIDSVDDVPHQKGNLMVYGVSLTAIAAADGSTHHIYHAKPKAADAEPGTAGAGGEDATE